MKRAFTLAEILITLGVIGVIAAMALPTVIENYQKQRTINQLKKVYTVLNQAFKMSEIDNDSYVNWYKIADIGGKAYIEKYWQPYLKVIKTCSTPKLCGYKNNFPWMNLNKTKAASVNYMNDQYYIIINDGTILQFSSYDYGTINVDLNGIYGPNQYGKDLFDFKIFNKGVMLRGNWTSISNYCSKTYNGGDNGEYCGGKIQYDGWKIKDDYPW